MAAEKEDWLPLVQVVAGSNLCWISSFQATMLYNVFDGLLNKAFEGSYLYNAEILCF